MEIYIIMCRVAAIRWDPSMQRTLHILMLVKYTQYVTRKHEESMKSTSKQMSRSKGLVFHFKSFLGHVSVARRFVQNLMRGRKVYYGQKKKKKKTENSSSAISLYGEKHRAARFERNCNFGNFLSLSQQRMGSFPQFIYVGASKQK